MVLHSKYVLCCGYGQLFTVIVQFWSLKFDRKAVDIVINWNVRVNSCNFMEW